MEKVETVVVDSTSESRIVEIVFRGGDWKDDREIRGVIQRVAAETDADALLINLSSFRYRGGDYASGFLVAFFDADRRAKRPACFVGADAGLRPLFNSLDPTGVFAVRFFEDRGEAVTYLRTRLQPTD
jgi:hypothetical protein